MHYRAPCGVTYALLAADMTYTRSPMYVPCSSHVSKISHRIILCVTLSSSCCVHVRVYITFFFVHAWLHSFHVFNLHVLSRECASSRRNVCKPGTCDSGFHASVRWCLCSSQHVSACACLYISVMQVVLQLCSCK